MQGAENQRRHQTQLLEDVRFTFSGFRVCQGIGLGDAKSVAPIKKLGEPGMDPIYYNYSPDYGVPPEGTPNLGKPHLRLVQKDPCLERVSD